MAETSPNVPERCDSVICGVVTSRFGTLRQTPASFGLFAPLSSKAGMAARRARKMEIYFRDVRLVLFIYSLFLVPDFETMSQ